MFVYLKKWTYSSGIVIEIRRRERRRGRRKKGLGGMIGLVWKTEFAPTGAQFNAIAHQ